MDDVTTPEATPTLNEELACANIPQVEKPSGQQLGGVRFWGIFASLMVVMFLSALDFVRRSSFYYLSGAVT